MVTLSKSVALSHVGKVRANNQDSGYCGEHLFIVADGMGGHAGGDVASAVALTHIVGIDKKFATAQAAEKALHAAFTSANRLLAEMVFEHTELTGMGTTVSAVVVVNDEVVIAHIGDSRIYRLRGGELTQVTADHTFVQRLVDSGRITEEEAAVHPRRSVLMRVLGDVDATPEIDTAILATLPGDRWLLCSDGLSSYVTEEKIRSALVLPGSLEKISERLVKEALDQGAPDNVTAVLVDIDGSGDAAHIPPLTVGSAASPLVFDGDSLKKPVRLPSLLLHPLKTTKSVDSHFEPESDDFLADMITEDQRRGQRRKLFWFIGLVVAVVAILTALVGGYRWTQNHYFVGSNGSTVTIYRGVQQNLGPISLSSVYRETSVAVSGLTNFSKSTLEETINATSLADAERIVGQLAMSGDH